MIIRINNVCAGNRRDEGHGALKYEAISNNRSHHVFISV